VVLDHQPDYSHWPPGAAPGTIGPAVPGGIFASPVAQWRVVEHQQQLQLEQEQLSSSQYALQQSMAAYARGKKGRASMATSGSTIGTPSRRKSGTTANTAVTPTNVSSVAAAAIARYGPGHAAAARNAVLAAHAARGAALAASGGAGGPFGGASSTTGTRGVKRKQEPIHSGDFTAADGTGMAIDDDNDDNIHDDDHDNSGNGSGDDDSIPKLEVFPPDDDAGEGPDFTKAYKFLASLLDPSTT
jgi:hypothetical protein